MCLYIYICVCVCVCVCEEAGGGGGGGIQITDGHSVINGRHSIYVSWCSTPQRMALARMAM